MGPEATSGGGGSTELTTGGGRAAAASAAWPPEGWVDRDEAAKRIGVNPRTLREWVEDGSLPYGGTMATAPDGRRRRIYELAELGAALQRMRTAVAARAALPEGYVSRDEAAGILGIAPDTLALWHTNGRLRCGVWVKTPAGKRAKIYPRGEVERVRDELAADQAAREKPPAGFVDTDGACEMFGVTRAAWMIWKRQGKVPRGAKWRSAAATYCRIYDVEELRAVLAEFRGEDKVYLEGGASRRFHIPRGWVQPKDAAAMFGVTDKTFLRWEQEGLITCGRTETGRRIKIYPRDELERVVAENGRYAPPYPDPDRPGCYRVPLAGHDMQRREAIIDAADVPLVEGRRFHFTPGEGGNGGHGRVQTFNPGGDSRLHHLIMGVSATDCHVGHRNDDPLDCRRANLVMRSRSEVGANMRKARTFCGRPTTSRFKGVCWDKRRGKWLAYIKKEQVSRSLGRYRDEIAAAEAYDEAARELFGEHARPNFRDGVDAYLAQAGDARTAA